MFCLEACRAYLRAHALERMPCTGSWRSAQLLVTIVRLGEGVAHDQARIFLFLESGVDAATACLTRVLASAEPLGVLPARS